MNKNDPTNPRELAMQDIKESLLEYQAKKTKKQFAKEYPKIGVWLKKMPEESLFALFDYCNKYFLDTCPEENEEGKHATKDQFLEGSEYMRGLYNVEKRYYDVLMTIVAVFWDIEVGGKPNKATLGVVMNKLVDIVFIEWGSRHKAIDISDTLRIGKKSKVYMSQQMQEAFILREKIPKIFDLFAPSFENNPEDFVQKNVSVKI